MPLYRPENPYSMGQKALGQASSTMASQTKEGPRTEVEASSPSAGQMGMTGLSLLGAGEQAWRYGSEGYDFLQSKHHKDWHASKSQQELNENPFQKAHLLKNELRHQFLD